MHDGTTPHDDELTPLERQLAALVPQDRLDRDRIMFSAGLRVGRRRLQFTSALVAATSVACGALVASLVMQPAAPHEPLGPQLAGDARNVAPLDRPDTRIPSIAHDAPTNYQLLRALSNNLDAQIAYAPNAPAAIEADREPDPPQNPRSLLKRYLETTPQPL
jgi:hypothetical protein